MNIITHGDLKKDCKSCTAKKAHNEKTGELTLTKLAQFWLKENLDDNVCDDPDCPFDKCMDFTYSKPEETLVNTFKAVLAPIKKIIAEYMKQKELDDVNDDIGFIIMWQKAFETLLKLEELIE